MVVRHSLCQTVREHDLKGLEDAQTSAHLFSRPDENRHGWFGGGGQGYLERIDKAGYGDRLMGSRAAADSNHHHEYW